MLNAKRIAHRLLLVLVLLNGLVGVLLWRGVVTGSSRALVGSIPYPPNHRLVVIILPVIRVIPSSSNDPAKYDSGNHYSRNEVWVDVRTQDQGQHTLTKYVSAKLPLRRLAVLPHLAVTSFLALLVTIACAVSLWNASRRVAPAVSTVVTSSHGLTPEDISTLSWQIQDQVGGRDRSAVPLVTVKSRALRSEYVATLPAQIQDQVRGTVRAAAVTRSRGLSPEYITSLPQQIQAQVRGFAQASSR